MVVFRDRLDVVLVTKNHAGLVFLNDVEHDVLSLIEVTSHEHAFGLEAETKNGGQDVSGLLFLVCFIGSEVKVANHDAFLSAALLHTSWDADIVLTHGSRCPNCMVGELPSAC